MVGIRKKRRVKLGKKACKVQGIQTVNYPEPDSYNTSKRAFTGVKDAGPYGPPLACVKVVRGQDGAVTGARARSAHDFCRICSPT
jgi:hypothetical protein